MRNAALMLGIVGGLLGMIVGFFGYGYVEFADRYDESGRLLEQLENAGFIQIASFLAPLLAIAGGAMAKIRALWGGLLLLVAAYLMYEAFGFGVFTMFPIGFCAVGGLLALAAGKPDEPKAHF
ncbi:MAG: hypothetical protein ACQEUZ_10815 [Pseudomonadota bacterium]